MFGIKEKAKSKARRAGLVSAGGLFLFVGLGFLTVAGWFFLTTSFPPLEAALSATKAKRKAKAAATKVEFFTMARGED